MFSDLSVEALAKSETLAKKNVSNGERNHMNHNKDINKFHQTFSFIQTNTPLRDKNWFQTGGPARFYCEPESNQEFQQALTFAQKNKLEIFVLGQGANILISDNGFDGLVIRPKNSQITIIESANNLEKNEILVHCDAGVTMQNLIAYCLDHNICGLEEFSGIPGTIGGSVYINLHYFEFLLEQFLVYAEVINKATGHIKIVNKDWFHFGYNTSTLHQKDYYLLNSTFKLKKCSDFEAAYAKGRRIEIIRHRHKRYPSTHTCGSFFRNFYSNEVTIESNGKKMIYVAYYLDKIGVKGLLKKGDAVISYQHANMIVNQGKATTDDIVAIARQMQALVKKEFGIIPQPECQLIGFKTYPLL